MKSVTGTIVSGFVLAIIITAAAGGGLFNLSGYETILSGGGQRGAFAWRNIDASLVPGLVAQTVEAGTWSSSASAHPSSRQSGLRYSAKPT